MKSSNELRNILRSIDRKSYPAYKSLAGCYDFDSFTLFIDHVQETLLLPRLLFMWKYPTAAQAFRKHIIKGHAPVLPFRTF